MLRARAGASGAASPVITSTSASSSTTRPRPPASTTPARASAGSCSGVRASASAAPSAAAGRPGRVRRCRRRRRLGRRRGRPTGSCPRPDRRPPVGRVGGVGQAGRERCGRSTVGHLERAGQTGQQLRDDHAGVAARAEQRAAGERQHRVAEIGRGRAVELLLGGGEREHEIGAGVAVGHREDVELVDLALVPAQTPPDRSRTTGGWRRRRDCPARNVSLLVCCDTSRGTPVSVARFAAAIAILAIGRRRLGIGRFAGRRGHRVTWCGCPTRASCRA